MMFRMHPLWPYYGRTNVKVMEQINSLFSTLESDIAGAFQSNLARRPPL